MRTEHSQPAAQPDKSQSTFQLMLIRYIYTFLYLSPIFFAVTNFITNLVTPYLRCVVKKLRYCFWGTFGILNWVAIGICLFINFRKHIQEIINCCKERPILILLDNQSSHCTIYAIHFSNKNGLHIVTFHTHTLHSLYLLNVVVYAPFNNFFKRHLKIGWQTTQKKG